MSERLLGTVSAAKAIQRVKYSHDAMIDLIVTTPEVTQGDIARAFGMTQAWVSRVMNSDAFHARLALRKEELIDPILTASIEDRLKNVATKSLDIILEKLHTSPTADLAMKAMELSTKALNYGARPQQPQQVNFVVALPGKSREVKDWAQRYTPGEGEVIEAEGEAEGKAGAGGAAGAAG